MSDYKVKCDASGFICMRSECKIQWNGLLVRADFFEERHPQDFIRPIKESQPPKEIRNGQLDVALDVPPITPDQII